MEWLLNRRRMMIAESAPPVYLTFEDPEVWRICCINYGDYIETVITNNEDNTVDIVRKFRSVIMNSNQLATVTKKIEVLETQTNVDNSGGTYTEGTTKEPVGITQRQCDAITNLGYYSNSGKIGITNKFINKSAIVSGNDLMHFRKLTSIYGSYTLSKTGGFSGCSNLESAEIPNSVIELGYKAFCDCSKLTSFDFKNVEVLGRQAFAGTRLTTIVLNEGFREFSAGGSYGPFANLQTLQYVDFPSTTVTLSGDTNMFRYGSPVVVCRAATPPDAAFGYANSNVTLYVPQESLDAYKSATGWSRFAAKTYAIEGTWYETHRELEPTT